MHTMPCAMPMINTYRLHGEELEDELVRVGKKVVVLFCWRQSDRPVKKIGSILILISIIGIFLSKMWYSGTH